MAVIINGKEIARKKREEAALLAAALKERGIIPALAVILAGDDPASISYVAAKEKALREAGMKSLDIRLPEKTTEAELVDRIAALNSDSKIHGILVQLPLPDHINKSAVINAVDPAKDVDGFHPLSAGNLVLRQRSFLPCTPHGVLVLLNEMNIPTAGAHVTIVGRSDIVGRPLANLLLRKENNATVTVCHTGSGDLGRYTREADILIAAAGKAGLITADMVKEGAAVIDVGINRIPDNTAKNGYRLAGDVDFLNVEKKASYITPVPGGVGPMTIAMLLHNVIIAAQEAEKR